MPIIALLAFVLSGRLKKFSNYLPEINLSDPIILAINTPLDEAWQSLFHIRNSENPLVPNSSWLKYIFASYLENVKRGDKIGRIRGEKGLSEAKQSTKIGIITFCLFAICLIIGVFATDQLFGKNANTTTEATLHI